MFINRRGINKCSKTVQGAEEEKQKERKGNDRLVGKIGKKKKSNPKEAKKGTTDKASRLVEFKREIRQASRLA